MPYNNSPYGLLYSRDLTIQRKQFKEATKLIGMPGVKYRAPLPGKTFDQHGDLDADYFEERDIGCFFHEHPDQKTMKKIGWVAELQEGSSLIEVAYDTPHLQVGSLFLIPAGIDFAEPRWFRVISMQNIMLCPVSITCEIAPEYEDVDEPVIHNDHVKQNFTLLLPDEDDEDEEY